MCCFVRGTSYVHVANSSRIIAHFYSDHAGVSGPPMTSRRRHFRSGCGFHLRRAGNRRATSTDRRTDGRTRRGQRRWDCDVIDHRHDRRTTATNRAPRCTTHGHSYVLVIAVIPGVWRFGFGYHRRVRVHGGKYKKKKKIPHRPRSVARELIPL